MKKITVLGSTGSIGTNTLELVERLKDRFSVVGLAAGSNLELLRQQVVKFRPKIVSVRTEEQARKLRDELGDFTGAVVHGPAGAEEVARWENPDIVVSAITGINGLGPTLAAVRCGARLALANKESMVVAGPLVQSEARWSGAEIIPVDSEHSGVFQCLAGESRENIRRVILTASGGPFFRASPEAMKNKTVEEVLAHPRWKMGRKVTVDSATLMNKGLELIEARWLFGLRPAELDILIHPQSIVHSLVEMKDGSTLAQLSVTDMKIPIQYALTYPEREASPLPSLDLAKVRSLEFYEVEEDLFPLLRLARQALRSERSLPVALNAANEAAVAAFLERRIGFGDIAAVVTAVLEKHDPIEVLSLETVLEVDRRTRAETEEFIQQRF